MRHQLKPKTPSARARMHYILRAGRYGVNQARAAELVAAGVANLPSWADGPAGFWSAVDGYERKNARLCLELELNVPRELSREGQVAAIASYIDRLTAEAGRFPITWAVHDSGDGNPHCHLMLQERPLDGRELSGPQQHFRRANRKNPANGGVAKSEWWHKRENVFWSRALWADVCNQQLLAEGQAARFDPRRKSQRLDEALRAGDLRRAAVLCTQTERHEGPAVASARRRLAAGRVQAAELPEQVMQIINGNDQARSFNCWLRDWAPTASEKELQLFLADHLHDLHQTLAVELQGAHIEVRAAWLEKQHAEALDDDRQRAVAAAQQAGELELLTAAQIEQAERAALAAELAELIALEQGDQLDDLLAIEVEQAHGAALAEDAQRARHRAQCLSLIAKGREAGWLGDDEAEGLLYGLIDPHTLEWLQEAVADLGDADAEHSYRQWLAVQAAHAEALAEDAQRTADLEARPVSLVEQLNAGLAGLAGLQQSAPDLDDPATLTSHHDDERQWIEFEGQDGDVLGCWADDPDTQWRYDAEADDWVAHDPDHRPSSGPRMG